MSNVFQDQFSSVFSDPNSAHVQPPSFSPPTISQPMTDEDLNITDDDILNAIKEIKSDSAAGPDGIPVILRKNCAAELCHPLKILYSESFHTNTVPKFYKSSNISPQYKKGARAVKSNYRPISLTSHIINIFERVL